MSSMWARSSAICSCVTGRPSSASASASADPQPPPGAELPLVAPQRGHLARGVAGDERVFVDVVRHRPALFLFLRWAIIQNNKRQHDHQCNQAKCPNDLAQRANWPMIAPPSRLPCCSAGREPKSARFEPPAAPAPARAAFLWQNADSWAIVGDDSYRVSARLSLPKSETRIHIRRSSSTATVFAQRPPKCQCTAIIQGRSSE